jgi:hypothetical protein
VEGKTNEKKRRFNKKTEMRTRERRVGSEKVTSEWQNISVLRIRDCSGDIPSEARRFSGEKQQNPFDTYK